MLEVAIPEASATNYVPNKSQTGDEIHNANPGQNKLGSTFHPKQNRSSSRTKKILAGVMAGFVLIWLISLIPTVFIRHNLNSRNQQIIKKGQEKTVLPYVNSENNNIYSQDLNIQKPMVIRKFDYKSQSLDQSPLAVPIANNNVIYFGLDMGPDAPDWRTSHKVYAISLNDGKEFWKKPIDKDSYSFSNNNLFTVCAASGSRATICALDSENGNVLWTFNNTRIIAFPGMESSPRGHAPITSELLISKGRIYFTAEDNYLYALNAITGEKVWEFTDNPNKESIKASYFNLAVSNNVVYFYSYGNGTFHALDASSGKLIWKTEIVFPDPTSTFGNTRVPVVANGKVFISDSGGKMYALDALTGKILWQYLVVQSGGSGINKLISQPVVDATNVYLAGSDGYLRQIDQSTGRETNKIFLGNYRLSTPVVTNGSIYVLSKYKYPSQSEDQSLTSANILFAIDKPSLQKKWEFVLDNACGRDNCLSNSHTPNYPIIVDDKIIVVSSYTLYEIGDAGK